MNKPPEIIDNAKVLFWAWSGEKPFGIVHYEDGSIAAEIYGLAICQYNDSDTVYRFSCNKKWETEQDGEYRSVKEAQEKLPDQYRNVPVQWIKFEWF